MHGDMVMRMVTRADNISGWVAGLGWASLTAGDSSYQTKNLGGLVERSSSGVLEKKGYLWGGKDVDMWCDQTGGL